MKKKEREMIRYSHNITDEDQMIINLLIKINKKKKKKS